MKPRLLDQSDETETAFGIEPTSQMHVLSLFLSLFIYRKRNAMFVNSVVHLKL